MKRFALIVVMLFACVLGYGQAQIAETVLIKPKPGHATDLEEALQEHNEKFHAAGSDHEAMVRYIAYGNYGGWYVWVMKGGYASLDSRPTDSNHQGDWAKTVDPHVMDYGPSTLWRLNTALSTGIEEMNNATKYRAWQVEFKDGQGYRFRPLMEKMKAAQEKVGNSFVIYNNVVNMKGHGSVAIIWPFNNYAEWDEEGANIRDAYVELHGDGSWVSFLDEWRAIVESIDEEVREKL